MAIRRGSVTGRSRACVAATTASRSPRSADVHQHRVAAVHRADAARSVSPAAATARAASMKSATATPPPVTPGLTASLMISIRASPTGSGQLGPPGAPPRAAPLDEVGHRHAAAGHTGADRLPDDQHPGLAERLELPDTSECLAWIGN